MGSSQADATDADAGAAGDFARLVELAELDHQVGQLVASARAADCAAEDFDTVIDDGLATAASAESTGGVVRSNLTSTAQQVSFTPSDDLSDIEQTLAQLGDGSTVTFASGTYSIDRSLVIAADVTVTGAGGQETILESRAAGAAIAVLGNGSLTMTDLSIEHIGDEPASVVVSVDGGLALRNVGLSGAIGGTSADDRRGSGVVLAQSSTEVQPGAVTINGVAVRSNDRAGIVVSGERQPTISNTSISLNTECGLCFEDQSSGLVQFGDLSSNGVGVHISGQASPELSSVNIVDNERAGAIVENDATPLIVRNLFTGEGTIGVEVHDGASPKIQLNSFGAHAVAISLGGTSTADVANNEVSGGQVGIRVADQAAPVANLNQILDTTEASMLHTGQSTGVFRFHRLQTFEGVTIQVEDAAAPSFDETTIFGGTTGVVFADEAAGSITNSELRELEVAIEATGSSSPTISANTINAPTVAGIRVSGASSAQVIDNTIEDAASTALEATEQSSPSFEMNSVVGGQTGVTISGTSTPTLFENIINPIGVGIAVSGQAEPTIEENEVRVTTESALVFEDQSAGMVQGNGLGSGGATTVLVADMASPTLQGNEILAFGSVLAVQVAGDDDAPEAEIDVAGQSLNGIVYLNSAAGAAIGNSVFGFETAIAVNDEASPALSENRVGGIKGAGIDGDAVGFRFGQATTSVVEGNVVADVEVGFLVADTASPTLTSNSVERAGVAAFSIEGSGTPTLSGNECAESAAGIVVIDGAAPILDENECPVG